MADRLLQTFNARSVGQSNVVLRKPTYTQAKEFKTQLAELASKIQLDENGKPLDGDTSNVILVSNEIETLYVSILCNSFVSWSWTDSEGKQLPAIESEQDMNALTLEEGEYLLECVKELYGVSAEAQKKLKK